MNRKLLAAAALAAALPALQGCVTVAAVGAGTVALMADDRRTTGVYVEDESIEWKVIAKVMGDFKGSHINATSFNRKVLLTGFATTSISSSPPLTRMTASGNALTWRDISPS